MNIELPPKFFNTAGPIQPDIHYNVDSLTRINLDEILGLIHQRKYFVLHAPRQTGKTSCLLALRDYLNRQGQYICVYANVEAGQAARNDVKEVVETTASAIAYRTEMVLKSRMPREILQQLKKEDVSPGSFLTDYIRALCWALPKPLVLFIDEIDALVGDSLVSVLRQIRAGYDQRPESFPQSIVLCGVRDVRDYRIVLSNQDIVTGGSAFNIKAKSLRLGNFTKEEIHDLYMQHTAATGQEFDEACFPLIWEATEGQPWLVNALGYEVTYEMKENRDRSIRIIPEMIYHAQERIIYRRDTHIDILIDKLIKASKATGIKDIAIAGGVSANSGLRNGITEAGRRRGWRTFLPELKFTTDNAAMIATAGYYRYMAGQISNLEVSPVARLQDL